jgi:hypothetical protein
MFIEVDIGVKLEPLDEVVVGLPATRAEGRGVDTLEALAQRHAERHVALRIAGHDRDVLDRVERLGAERRIGERRPVLLPAIGPDLRAFGLFIRPSRERSNQQAGSGQKCRHEPRSHTTRF